MKITQIINLLLKPIYKYRTLRRYTFDTKIHDKMTNYGDYCRLASFGLALSRIETEHIAGDLAEVGVYKGDVSRFIHKLAPNRILHLFDTFSGFSEKDFSETSERDSRFDNTSIDIVKRNLGDTVNVQFHKGFVPESLNVVSEMKFAFVSLDLDLHDPTIGALNFFYERLTKGAYLFVHDFNTLEPKWGCHKALTSFLENKQEKIIEIPDISGSALFRKV